MLQTWNKRISAILLVSSIIVGVFFLVQSILSSEIDILRSIYIYGAGVLFTLSLIDTLGSKSSTLKTTLLLATSFVLVVSCIYPSLLVRFWNYQLILIATFLFFSLHSSSPKQTKFITVIRVLTYVIIIGALTLKITDPLFFNSMLVMIGVLTAVEIGSLFLIKNQK